MILAIDQGTTGTTCLVFDEQAELIGRAYREFEQHFPRPGWVEHDARPDLGGHSCGRRRGARRRRDRRPGELQAVGITNQRETVCVWDPDTGEPLHRAIVWQDRRTAARCDQLRAAGRESLCASGPAWCSTRTSRRPRSSGCCENVEGLRERADDGRAIFGTIDAWLIHRLTGERVTDPSNASRTMLFDIGSGRWDGELLDLFGVPERALPEVVSSCGPIATTRAQALHGHEVPIAGIAGDQQAALFGQACVDPGLGKNTYGTGSFVLQNAGFTAPAPADGLLGTVAWRIGERLTYALEAAIFVTGAAVQWLRDGLGIIEVAAETEALAGSLESNDGVYFVPALTGLGSPHWDPYARGTIVGPDPWQRPRPSRPRGARVDRIPDRRRSPRDRGSLRDRADRAARRRRRHRQRLADAVPGRHPWRPGQPAGGRRDDGAGRRLPGRRRVGMWTIHDVSAGWREKRRYEPRMSRTSASSCWPTGGAPLQRARGWDRA